MSATNIRRTPTSYASPQGILLAIGVAGFSTLSAPALAAQPSDFPNKPIRIIAGFSTGSTVDLSARVVAEKLAGAFAVYTQTPPLICSRYVFCKP